jgi:nucleoid-associated protein YgaU
MFITKIPAVAAALFAMSLLAACAGDEARKDAQASDAAMRQVTTAADRATSASDRATSAAERAEQAAQRAEAAADRADQSFRTGLRK